MKSETQREINNIVFKMSFKLVSDRKYLMDIFLNVQYNQELFKKYSNVSCILGREYLLKELLNV